jgi:NAD-dependent dihydropyrimidine dehydrogenase PreA subunit
MSHRVLEDVCIGCGGCEYACPAGSLTKTDSYLGLFVIDPFTCDDCGQCVDKCPVLAIEPDPAWAVCGDRGCPLKSARLADTTCAVWQDTCPSCGTTMWRRDDGGWQCPRCDMHMKVACPRTNKLPSHGHQAPVADESVPVAMSTNPRLS